MSTGFYATQPHSARFSFQRQDRKHVRWWSRPPRRTSAPPPRGRTVLSHFHQLAKGDKNANRCNRPIPLATKGANNAN